MVNFGWRWFVVLSLLAAGGCSPSASTTSPAEQVEISRDPPAATQAAMRKNPPSEPVWNCTSHDPPRSWHRPFQGELAALGAPDPRVGFLLGKIVPLLQACRGEAQASAPGRLWFELATRPSGGVSQICTSAAGEMDQAAIDCIRGALLKFPTYSSLGGDRFRSSIDLTELSEKAPAPLPRVCVQAKPTGQRGVLRMLNNEAGQVFLMSKTERYLSGEAGATPARPMAGLTARPLLGKEDLDDVGGCYAALLEREPRASGQLSFSLKSGARHRVSEVCSEGAGLDEETRGCVVEVLSRLTLPPSRSRVFEDSLEFDSRFRYWPWLASCGFAFEPGSPGVPTPSVGDDPAAPRVLPPRPPGIKLPGKK